MKRGGKSSEKKGRGGKYKRPKESKKSSPKKIRASVEEDAKRFKKRIAIILVLILVIAVFAWLFFKVYISEENGNKIDKSIKFPRDEGSHDEPYEFWRVIFLLTSTESNRFGVSATYTKHSEDFGGENQRQLLITDEGNVSGTTYYAKTNLGNLTAEEGRLNLTYKEKNGLDRDFWIQLEGFNYSFHAEIYSGTSKFVAIDLTLEYLKPPILIGDEGKIFDATLNYGTIYGYSQTRLLAQGTLILNGSSHNVQGLAWINHQWGVWSYTNKEYWQFQLENGIDIAVFRFYSSDSLLYEHFYVVDLNGMLTSVEDYELENLKYLIAPADPDKESCVSSKWRFASSSLSLTAVPTIQYQFSMPLGWEGSIVGSGILSGFDVNGRGYALIHNAAETTLSINEVEHNYIDPLSNTTITANVTDDIPIVNATLYYNTSVNPTIIAVPMNYMGNNQWYAEIPQQPYLARVYYYIEAYDLADAYQKSEWFEYTIS